jgi:hypothetical protein
MKNVMTTLGFLLIGFGLGNITAHIERAQLHGPAQLIESTKESPTLVGNKVVTIQGIEFVNYGGPTPLVNLCTNCERYCLSKWCGNCGTKQKIPYYYEAYCPGCGNAASGYFKYCLTCGTCIAYRKTTRK